MKEFFSFELFEVGGIDVTVSTVATSILVLAAAAVISRLLQRALVRILGVWGIKREGPVASTRGGLIPYRQRRTQTC